MNWKLAKSSTFHTIRGLTGSHVSENAIFGLLFMQGTGMIIDLVYEVAEFRYLTVPFHEWFPMHKWWTNQMTQFIKSRCSFLSNTIMPKYRQADQWSNIKILHHTLVPSQWHVIPAMTMTVLIMMPHLFSDTLYIEEDLDCGWVPPTSVNKDNNYHSSVLKKDGYLVSLCQ